MLRRVALVLLAAAVIMLIAELAITVGAHGEEDAG